MKAIYFLDSVNVGGTEVLALDVCRNAAAAGIEMTFITCRGGEMEDEFRNSGVSFLKLARRMPIDPALVRELRRVIRLHEISVVHTHQAVEALHAYMAARGSGAKVILSHHGFVPDVKNRMALKYLMPRVDLNVFVSHGLRDWYQEYLKLEEAGRSTVLYNGIDPKRLKDPGFGVRASLGVPNGALLFGMTANFYASPRKDQKTLIEAFVKVAPMIPHSHLVLAGGTEEGAEAKFAECVSIAKGAGLSHRVHFLGRSSDIPAILAALDVFVLSSVHEGLGIAAIEAMMTHTPCILSDIPPLREVSGGGKAAELFPPGDSLALAEKMHLLAEDSEARMRLAERGFEYAIENFAIDAHVRQLAKLYAEVAAR
jgi:L-malate glycosyltransferase